MRVEIENPMVLPVYEPPYEQHSELCWCGRKAVYEVDGEPHCKLCMYDAIDTDIEVAVKKI